jgi:hypothetical protein
MSLSLALYALVGLTIGILGLLEARKQGRKGD